MSARPPRDGTAALSDVAARAREEAPSATRTAGAAQGRANRRRRRGTLRSYGYEETRSADVATTIGLTPTSLYHYFASKQHCLYEIMFDGNSRFRREFDEIIASHDRFEDALSAVLHAHFSLRNHEVTMVRVLIAEQGRLSQPRRLEREEAARQRALAGVRETEEAWTNLFAHGMAIGAIPETDPPLLTRAVLGFFNSVWDWYRPDRTLTLEDVAHFYVPRIRLMVGLSPAALPQDGAVATGEWSAHAETRTASHTPPGLSLSR